MNELYDYSGNALFNSIDDSVLCERFYDEASGTLYYLTRIFKKKTNGLFQYPFVRKCFPVNKSVYDLVIAEGWYLAINSSSNKQFTIQNGEHVGNLDVPTRPPLTIDADGNLGYIDMEDITGGVVPEGVVSAVVGWMPIITNYTDCTEYDSLGVDQRTQVDITTMHAQREIIGQYGNGDYAIITCEGRAFDNSTGFDYAQARAVCKKHNLKFAYDLDGGGSTQLVYGKKNMNIVYENETGRPIWTAIVFNGKSQYEIPSSTV